LTNLRIRVSKESMVETLTQGVQDLQDATDLADELAARRLSINRTDLRCLSRLVAQGPMTAGELAAAAGLTAGAATTVIDRLERAGLAERVRGSADRRRVLVHLTDQANAATDAIWGPVHHDAVEQLANFTLTELAVIQQFLATAMEVQQRQASR